MMFCIGYCPINNTFVRVNQDTGYLTYEPGNRAHWQNFAICESFTGAHAAMYKSLGDMQGQGST